MTREEALVELAELSKENRPSGDAHERADEILCELLVTLGYPDVAEAWNSVRPKWYE